MVKVKNDRMINRKSAMEEERCITPLAPRRRRAASLPKPGCCSEAARYEPSIGGSEDCSDRLGQLQDAPGAALRHFSCECSKSLAGVATEWLAKRRRCPTSLRSRPTYTRASLRPTTRRCGGRRRRRQRLPARIISLDLTRLS